MRGGGGGGGARGGGGGGTRGGMRGGTPEPLPEAAGTVAPGVKVFTARNLRLVLFTDKGELIADNVPVARGSQDDRGWYPVSASLEQMSGPKDATKVRAVGIFSDESDVFYLGRVSLVEDNKPVEVTVKAAPLMARPEQVIEFTATLRGGPVEAVISWDFDKKDGLTQQAVGPEVKYLYKESGDYIVTCTVTDKDGVRKPAVGSVGIRVEGTPLSQDQTTANPAAGAANYY